MSIVLHLPTTLFHVFFVNTIYKTKTNKRHYCDGLTYKPIFYYTMKLGKYANTTFKLYSFTVPLIGGEDFFAGDLNLITNRIICILIFNLDCYPSSIKKYQSYFNPMKTKGFEKKSKFTLYSL